MSNANANANVNALVNTSAEQQAVEEQLAIQGRIIALPRPRRAVIDPRKTFTDYSVNVREATDYDIPSMMEEERAAGFRILKPVVLEETSDPDRLLTIQGNRRLTAARELLKDSSLTKEQKDSLTKVEALIYPPLTEEQRMLLVFDHTEKKLSRYEIAMAIRRVSMYTRIEDICERYWRLLADFSGNNRKVNQIPKIDLAATPIQQLRQREIRKEYLVKWFKNGTLGNFILLGFQLGSYIEEQFLKNLKYEDGKLEKDNIELRVNGTTLPQLRSAMNEDVADGNWDSANFTGPKFKAKIEELQLELATGPGGKKTKAPTPTAIREIAAMNPSSVVKDLFAVASGDREMSPDIATKSMRIRHWVEEIEPLLMEYGSRLPEPLASFVAALTNDPAETFKAKLEAYVAPLPAKEPVVEVKEESKEPQQHKSKRGRK